MKLPWDKKYLIISFHIIVTLIMVYFFKYCVDALAYSLTNLGDILNGTKNIISWLISTFSVVLIAFVIAYLLDPVVDFFQKRFGACNTKKIETNDKKSNKKNNRLLGTLITYLVIVGSLILLSFLLINKISKNNGNNIIESITIFINNMIYEFSLIYSKFEEILVKYGVFEQIYTYVQSIGASITGFISNLGNIFIDIISAIGSGVVNILLSLVVAFYFLKDKDKIKTNFNNTAQTFLPNKVYCFIKNGIGDVHAVFSGYIRGQLLDGTIMAILISIGLSLIKVKFAVIIGIISGFSNIIPYFGALMGFVFAISVSILSGEPMKAVYSIIVMVILQQVDTIFIVPKVVGDSVELSPVLVIIALSVFGKIFGIWGLVFAVPIFATIKIFLTRIYLRQKERKSLKED